jgi:hypothetical protein
LPKIGAPDRVIFTVPQTKPTVHGSKPTVPQSVQIFVCILLNFGTSNKSVSISLFVPVMEVSSSDNKAPFFIPP